MTAFTLAHLSDPHLAPLPTPRLHELVGKRALGYLNWIRNRHAIHRREIADALIADVKAQRPDHIAITGDLVNLALPDEFAQASAWLKGVGAAADVTVVPGNHDAYVAATQRRIADWADYMRSDDAGGDAALTFPFVRRRGPLTLIGVSSAVPTPPFMATGTLGRAQIDALDKTLTELADDPNFRVLLIHHPLASKSSYKRLTDADALLALLKRHRIDLVLHGHDHIHSTMWFEGPHGRMPAVGVPSASAAAHGDYPAAAYNLFSVSRDGTTWRCEQRVRAFIGDKIADARNVRLI